MDSRMLLFWNSFSGHISLGQGGMPKQGRKSMPRGHRDLGSGPSSLRDWASHCTSLSLSFDLSNGEKNTEFSGQS